MESGAAVGSKKPVLLVVDEIDGATGGGDNVCSPMLVYLMDAQVTAILKTSGFVQKLLQLTFDKPKRKGMNI